MADLRCATWNVLTDHYLSYGDYGHVSQQLLLPGARLPLVLKLVDNLDVDIIGIQEADIALVVAFDATGKWQVFWSPKNGGKPDGCLMLVKRGIATSGFWSRFYSDGSGHVAQVVTVAGLSPMGIPTTSCPSDHIPVVASVRAG